MMARPPVRKFHSVQALRALAAFSVALTHILYNALGMAPGAGSVRALYGAMPWGAGVDIFFVISGFVVIHASRSFFAAAGAAQRFIQRRLARIVPLYWLMTSLLLAEMTFMPDAVNGPIGGIGFIVKSYFFIPCARPNGVVQPVLSLGWTLNYEMFFYLSLLPFLHLRQRQAVTGLTLALAVFVLAGRAGLLHGVVLRSWSDPIILEFCAGMLLAALPGNFMLHGIWRWAIVIAALLLLHLQPGWDRIAAYGIPAALLVLAAVTGGPAGRLPRLEISLVRLGDASYALYLVHPFAMRAASLLWLHLHRPGGIYAYIAVSLALAQSAAIAIHTYFELPVKRWLRCRLEGQPVKSSHSIG